MSRLSAPGPTVVDVAGVPVACEVRGHGIPVVLVLDEFPRATFAVLDTAGHWLGRIERPAAFRALVADRLERLKVETAGTTPSSPAR